MKLKVVQVPSIKTPIMESPGFAKKDLSTYKLDLMALCGFSCSYCSSNEGNYLRINREKFADLTEAQTGERTYPATDPSLTFAWPDVLPKLDAQLKNKPATWGGGHTLVLSMLTDAFSPLPLADGTTAAALTMLMTRTSFRVRVLTKGAVVASPKWIDFFRAWPDRFTVGLSIGTLDDEWARRVEVGTSSPTARIKALRALQDAGVPTYGMLCPVFPDAMMHDSDLGLEALINAVRPDRCEHVWAEPYNDRTNWRNVRAGYDEGSRVYAWLTSVYGEGHKELWSAYAVELYERLYAKAKRNEWTHKLRYLLYEDGITDAHDARALGSFDGVLLQSKPAKDGLSTNALIAAQQRSIREMPKGV